MQIDEQKVLLGYELDEMPSKPDFYLMELLHGVRPSQYLLMNQPYYSMKQPYYSMNQPYYLMVATRADEHVLTNHSHYLMLNKMSQRL